MNHLDAVRTLLTERYLNEDSELGIGMDNCRIYDAFFNLITDPTQSPESIVHLLDTFTSSLDGFSTNKCVQSLVALACFEGLAKRRPKALNGTWETLVWVIVKYSSLPTINLGRGFTNFNYNITKPDTNEFIIEFCSPELCPNPCLRLELLRFIRIFNCHDFTYDRHRKPFRDNIINTLCEASDYYISLTVDQVPNVNPVDLQYIMENYGINIVYISDNYDLDNADLECRNTEIIPAFLKLTRKFALLGKEKPQSFNNEVNLEYKCNDSLGKQLSACLSMSGLIPEYSSKYKEWLDELIQVVANDYILQNYMIDILDTLTQLSLLLPHNIIKKEFHNRIAEMKDKLHNEFVKVYVKNYPTYQNLYEINGGIVPSEEYTLRCYQNNVKVSYINSDSDSDSLSSDMTDYGYTDSDADSDADSEESDWETDMSE